jgi:hypothetical protein
VEVIHVLRFILRSLFVVIGGENAIAAEQIEHFKRATSIEHGILRHEPGEFCGWPANHGVWSWEDGQEILVGFSCGQFVESSGHKIDFTTERDVLTRSMDGGKTWTVVEAAGYAESERQPQLMDEPIDFLASGFALRVKLGAGTKPPSFFYSYDKGDTWRGPFLFNGLDRMPELESMTSMTPRTDYHVRGLEKCMVFMSATKESWADRTFAIMTIDGGMSFSFVSWIIGPSEPYRAVMPQTIFLGGRQYLSLIRRRDMPPRDVECWIDAYYSDDWGQSWSFRSRVGYTGFGNSNGSPPAVIRLRDGRLLAAYANRSLGMILCRLSTDEGRTWGKEIILRDDFLTKCDHGFKDFGYPRLVERPDGMIVAIYYFATDERPQQHIASSIFSIDTFEPVAIRRSINPAPLP